MGIISNAGGPDLGGAVNFAGIGKGALLILAIILIIFIVGILTFVYYSKKIKKKQFRYNIPIFKEVNGKPYRIDADKAQEIFVPDTNISLYYLQKRKIYIARPTISMGKDEFWYSISENGEWVNFAINIDPEKNTLAQANYDHRDTRYAYINLKEIIKKNYSDKSVKWWKEYAPIISLVITGLVFLMIFWVLLAKFGKLVDAIAPMIEQFKQISENMAQALQTQQNLNSGIVQR